MAGPDSVEMTQARFAAIVAAYGGEAGHWPHAEREAAKRWLADHEAARTLVAHALALDHALATSAPVGASAGLEARLIGDFDRIARRWSWTRLAGITAEHVWPGAPTWQPACAFALAFAVGLVIAAFAPLDVAPSDDRAVGTFTLDAPPDADAGQDI